MSSSFCGFEFNHNNPCAMFFLLVIIKWQFAIVDGTQCVAATSKSNPKFDNFG
jgi:hypothetical protein